MKSADYIARFLSQKGVTDAFGIPGGVILELLYAMERTDGIEPHLCYHEQGAAFAAAGYGQCGTVPGVTFATCGPGVMNTLTSVADAYCDSTAMLVFTAHSHKQINLPETPLRVLYNQEFELAPIFSTVTKACVRIDSLDEVASGLMQAYTASTTGRRGPVLVDILSGLLTQELASAPDMSAPQTQPVNAAVCEHMADEILQCIAAAKRPVLLLGEGVKLAGVSSHTARLAELMGIPVLSSRYAQDIMPRSALYFGYIGTHAIRAANFILSKADLIVALGNRLAFPVQSESFRPLTENTKILRVDIDASEFARDVPGTVNYCADLADLVPALVRQAPENVVCDEWHTVCSRLSEELDGCDVIEPVRLIADILHGVRPEFIITSDVGNNEMWLSRAYELAKASNRILYSKTFGALGCSLSKAIGAQYASHEPVICFTGDQGLQMNVQELQTVSANHLRILIAVLNNQTSGMIREHEEVRHGTHYLLTTPESGYTPPEVEKIAAAYAIPYRFWPAMDTAEKRRTLQSIDGPLILEVPFDAGYSVTPHLKRGDPCQNLFPYLNTAQYNELNAL